MTEQQRELQTALGAVDFVEGKLEHEIEAKPSRREVVRIAVAAAVAISVLASAFSIAISTFALGQTHQTAADVRANERLAQQAYDSAQAANNQLTARGQASVPVPPPNPEDPAQTIVAASAARVLAALPPAPTAQQVAHQLAADQALNPPAPAPSVVIAIVADYLAAHPAPAGERGEPGVNGENGRDGEVGPQGERGEKGDKGDPPTAAEIQAAMCPPERGAFKEVTVAGGGDQTGTSYVIYGCVITPTTTEEPSSTPTSAQR